MQIDIEIIMKQQQEWASNLEKLQTEHKNIEKYIASLEGAIQACQVFLDINSKQDDQTI